MHEERERGERFLVRKAWWCSEGAVARKECVLRGRVATYTELTFCRLASSRALRVGGCCTSCSLMGSSRVGGLRTRDEGVRLLLPLPLLRLEGITGSPPII